MAVARALVITPALILADEPTAELDTVNRDRVVTELHAEADRGAVVVVATHDPDVAARCDGEIHLADGVITASLGIIPRHDRWPARPAARSADAGSRTTTGPWSGRDTGRGDPRRRGDRSR
ncbi:MAG: hypothetical protein ACRDVZ_14400 [Jiangellaceae bacterium]